MTKHIRANMSQEDEAMPRITKIESKKEKKKLRVAAYCRVSTSQDAQMESLEAQKEHYDQVIKSNEDWVYVGLYYDEGITGTKKEKRPGLMRLLLECEEGKIDLVLTKSISRFARNTVDCLEMVRMLSSYKVAIFFERENINTLAMEDELILSVLGSLAENESYSISENIRWGVRNRFIKGTYRQAIAPYGYRLEEGKLKIDEETAPVVRLIFDKYCTGKGVYTIMKELNEKGIPGPKKKPWICDTVSGILKNERYMGDTIYQKTFTDNNLVRHKNHGDCDQYHHQGTHEAIINEEQFTRVQNIMSQRKKERRIDSEEHDNKKKYVMTKRLICGECGSNMRRIKIQGRTSGTYIAWGCAKHCSDPDACHQKSVEEENIKVAFITLTNKLIFSKRELLEPFVDALQKSDIADVSEINQKLEGNAEKLNTLLSLAADGLIDPVILHRAQSELMENNAELNSRKKVLLQQIHGKNEAAAEAEMLLSRVKKMRVSDQFDEPFFRDCVRKAHVYSRQEFGFELNCGLLLKERLK